MHLVEAVYRESTGWPLEEKFGLIAQNRRAVIFIPSNIAEGYGRIHRKEYVHHLSIARDSTMEVETQLILAVRSGYAQRDEATDVWTLLQETGRLLHALIRSLRPDP